MDGHMDPEGQPVTARWEAQPTSFQYCLTPTSTSFPLGPHHCPWRRPLGTTALSFTPGSFSWIFPAAYPTAPTSPRLNQSIMSRPHLILGLLRECAPFLVLPFPKSLLNLSGGHFLFFLMIRLWLGFWGTTEVKCHLYYLISRMRTVHMVYRY